MQWASAATTVASCSGASTGSLRNRMAFIVNEPVEEYAAEHTTELLDLFERLAEETREKTTRRR